MNPARIRLPGHPDAACDLVAESVVDEYLRRDPKSRLNISVTGGRGALFVSGDVMSTADFDISQVIQRALGSVGVMAGVEPFVSIEPVVAERATLFGTGVESPVVVFGYATSETPELAPAPLVTAMKIAKALEEKRSTDDEWFWLGADGDVFVDGDKTQPTISIRIEHGTTSIEDARQRVTEIAKIISPDATIRVNELGRDESRGLGNVIGASGRETQNYGLLLPSTGSVIGMDPLQPQKGGAWLARWAARELVKRGAKAAMVRLMYLPGDRAPTRMSARDEKGKDLTAQLSRESLSLNRVMSEWWRSQLNADASRWGWVASSGLPWEV
jgi:S-adenosylmethionine synthetase